MARLYSASTNGFYLEEYPDGVTPPPIPDDVVTISDDEYNALFDGQAQGKRITSNASGYPILEDYPEDNRTDDELADAALAYAEENPVTFAMYQTLADLSNDKDFETNFKNKVKDKIKKDKEEKAAALAASNPATTTL